jgi:hypothetical protein
MFIVTSSVLKKFVRFWEQSLCYKHSIPTGLRLSRFAVFSY